MKQGLPGFFQHPAFGCPQDCRTLMIEIQNAPNAIPWPCEDANETDFTTSLDRPSNGTEELPFKDWYKQWQNGFWEFLLADASFAYRVESMVHAIWGTNEVSDQVINHVVSGDMKATMLSGTWEIMPGMPHPRGLTGCDYLSSYEVTLILGYSLCDATYFRSIRHSCPVACECRRGMDDCPITCPVT